MCIPCIPYTFPTLVTRAMFAKSNASQVTLHFNQQRIAFSAIAYNRQRERSNQRPAEDRNTAEIQQDTAVHR